MRGRGRPGLGAASPWVKPGQVLGASEARGRREGLHLASSHSLLPAAARWPLRTGGAEQFGEETVPEGAGLGAQPPPHLQRPQVQTHVLLSPRRVRGPLRALGVSGLIGVPAEGREGSVQTGSGRRRPPTPRDPDSSALRRAPEIPSPPSHDQVTSFPSPVRPVMGSSLPPMLRLLSVSLSFSVPSLFLALKKWLGCLKPFLNNQDGSYVYKHHIF